MENNFKNAKVGDRVWDIIHGWGCVTEYCDAMVSGIYVIFSIPKDSEDSSVTKIFYWFDGTVSRLYHQNGCDTRTLFWDEIKIKPPPRPKEKVKKTIKAWVNIIADEGYFRGWRIEDAVYESRSNILNARNTLTCKYLGDPIYIEHEYEEEK